MADPQGIAFFPGVQQVLRASYTLGHGITPGVCTLDVAPQAAPIGAGGDLVFAYGGRVMRFAQCKVDLATSELTSEGLVWRLAVLDRRWKWAFGEIYGEYNRIDAEGNIIKSSEKTPKELARLLLGAMGEQRFNVDALPDQSRPHVDWTGANPAAELAGLCDSLGCRVVLRFDGSVLIATTGIGGLLPNRASIGEKSLTVNSPERPDTIKVIGGPTIVQAQFELEAVGRDTDGTIKLIDDLSYTPTNGWGGETSLFSGVTGDDARKQALATVFRWYRIKLSEDAPKTVSDVAKIERLDQILPVAPQLVETFTDEDGVKRPRDARLKGTFWIENMGDPENSAESAEYKGDWRLLEDKGIVEFPQTVRKWDADAEQFTVADLKIECSFQVRSPETGAFHRMFYVLPVDGPRFGTGPEVVDKSGELRLEIYETPAASERVPGSWTDNKTTAQLEQKARYYAQGAAQKYAGDGAADATYNELVEISPDGAIAQVTWSVGEQGATTRASRNSETNPYVLPYDRRRLVEKVKQVVT